MSKLEDFKVTQEMLQAAAKVFAAVAVQTNSTDTAVDFTDFYDESDGTNYGSFSITCKWKRLEDAEEAA